MKIGIFFGYGPMVRLNAEGLGRYIANLIKGFLDKGSRVTVACPKWLMHALLDVFDEFSISDERIEFITSQKVPAVWRLYEWLDSRRTKPRRPRRRLFLRGCRSVLEWALGLVLSFTSMALLFIVLFLAGLLCLLCLPFALLASIPYMLYRLVNAAVRKQRFRLGEAVNRVKRMLGSLVSMGRSVESYLMERMTDNVIRELLRKIDRRDEDVWFVPAIFWPQVTKIKKVTVINVPDMVTTDLPNGFAVYNAAADEAKRCSSTIEDGKYFITYCEYLRQSLVIDRFGKPADHVVAIPHADNAMDGYLSFDESAALPGIYDKSNEIAFAREILKELPRYAAPELRDYLKGFDFGHIRYIFYASQLRPSKNMMNLVKAYEYLLRRRNGEVKLFLTCRLEAVPGVKDYIFSHRLQNDIITFHGLPAQVLAALYKCADLVVNPTLYEGGFPFTFGEGMSVGTPSVMSRIPQVSYVADNYDVEAMLFDPHDYTDIAAKIEYALEHLDQMYEMERRMYHEQFEVRTSAIVADEYLKAFQYFIDMDREEKELEKGKATLK